MEEIKEIILSHCQGIAYPEFDLEDLNVMVKEINDRYTNVQSQELTKAKEEIERLKKWKDWLEAHKDSHDIYCNHRDGRVCNCGLDELLKEVK
jgi:hypothetical protein